MATVCPPTANRSVCRPRPKSKRWPKSATMESASPENAPRLVVTGSGGEVISDISHSPHLCPPSTRSSGGTRSSATRSGYLPDEGEIEAIAFELPENDYLGFGPGLAPALVRAVLLHPRARLARRSRDARPDRVDGARPWQLKGSDFEVAGWVDRLGGHMERHPKFWIRLGNLESRMLKDELDKVRIEAPIYVAGLARSGSTFLLQALAEHEDTVTHRYKDFPPVFTPYWWNRFLGFMPKKEAAPGRARA